MNYLTFMTGVAIIGYYMDLHKKREWKWFGLRLLLATIFYWLLEVFVGW